MAVAPGVPRTGWAGATAVTGGEVGRGAAGLSRCGADRGRQERAPAAGAAGERGRGTDRQKKREKKQSANILCVLKIKRFLILFCGQMRCLTSVEPFVMEMAGDTCKVIPLPLKISSWRNCRIQHRC